jgi:small-conductance mechanosensitive channel
MLTKILKSFNLARFLFLLIALIFLGSACTETAEEPTPEPSNSATLDASSQNVEDSQKDDTESLVEAVASRTPLPTPTPDRFAVQIEQVTAELGIEQVTFLGLTTADWFNIGVSIITVIIGFIVLKWLLNSFLRRVVRRTETDFDDRFLERINRPLNWLVIIFLVDANITRLGFISVGTRAVLDDVFFVIYLSIGFYIAYSLVSFAADWYIARLDVDMDPNQFRAISVLITRMIYVFLGVIYFTILLDHFGISITAATAALGIGGLALSLGAQDTIADAIAGVIILVDQPFRIGDRIEIDGLDTWGDVTQIGMRTTRIRTRDNRLVIIPNSKIGNNAVVNYTFPDPNYRTQIELGIGYGNNIDEVERVIQNAVSKVDGLVPDKPVDVLFLEFGETDMTVRVRWWLDSYADTRYMYDRVNRAMLQAIDEAGISMPFTTYDVNIKVDDENVRRVSQALNPS